MHIADVGWPCFIKSTCPDRPYIVVLHINSIAGWPGQGQM